MHPYGLHGAWTLELFEAQCCYKLLTFPTKVCVHKQGKVFIRNRFSTHKKPEGQENCYVSSACSSMEGRPRCSVICSKVCAIGAGARALHFGALACAGFD